MNNEKGITFLGAVDIRETIIYYHIYFVQHPHFLGCYLLCKVLYATYFSSSKKQQRMFNTCNTAISPNNFYPIFD